MRSHRYQIALIFLGAIATAFFAVFVYRELFPEYRLYQKDYIALEQFRSTYTHKSPADFKLGVKQILLETPDNGQPVIDRCISCHVALDIPYFSPTKIAYDINGKMILDEKGIPVKVTNEDYIWGKLDTRIAELTDEQVNTQLKEQGDLSALSVRLKEAEELKALKIVEWNEQTYDVTKALSMHPLMGRETRPFEFHPVADYGCTSCHGGNGRALTADKAHGPVFEGQYEAENRGVVPKFLEQDPENDPRISTVFNHKPGEELVFQTTPILVEGLIQAKCMQCHQTGQQSIQGALGRTENVSSKSAKTIEKIYISYQNERKALLSLIKLRQLLETKGLSATITELNQELDQYITPPDQRSEIAAQLKFLMSHINQNSNNQKSTTAILNEINKDIFIALGSQELVKDLFVKTEKDPKNLENVLNTFIEEHRLDKAATGQLFVKANSLDYETALYQHVRDTEISLSKAVNDQFAMNSIQTDVDQLTGTYQRGKDLYIEQACYACHRISGFSRGGVGPELTQIGKNYPWYIKHHIVWPQGDLPTSTMPNYRLDHQELEPLMTFLLAQKGQNDAISKAEYKRNISEWETGKLQAWEKPITPTQIYDLRYSMTVFATEGCASCHRLKGYESDVGYAVEKEQKDRVDFGTLYQEREWFTKIFPEEILGSQIVEILDKHAFEIDQHIVEGVRKDSILEEIQEKYPNDIESFYTNFRFASRAKNKHYQDLASKELDPIKKQNILDQLEQYKKRLHRVLMIYIQEYGLGRLIGPRPNWSGVFRSDAWLMEHFIKPTAHVARSIMPVFPFDNSKFYALTHMLDVLGKRNRDWDRQLWENRGFNPAIAYQIHCSQCHGEFLGGNGPVSDWIYPIPKNLRSSEFLRNYTRDRVINSIIHGIKGTPMPPWGEVAAKPTTSDGLPVLTRAEIEQLAEWLFSTLPGHTMFEKGGDVPKWNYKPEDAIKELKEEGSQLRGQEHTEDVSTPLLSLRALLPNGKEYLAALNPSVATEQGLSVSDVFDVIKNPEGFTDQDSYYIKQRYYTEQNIHAGKVFFDVYCAVCHGSEADGMGPRAAVMQEAKPRMLNNLDWLNTHDDLYLLRSIKYGVPGTSMTPWGDQTSSLLRLQLVMYIRSLSREAGEQKILDESLFQTFDTSIFQIDAARVQLSNRINNTEMKLKESQNKQRELSKKSEQDPSFQNKRVEAFKQQLEFAELFSQEQQTDQLLVQLKKTVESEKKIFKDLGIGLLINKLNHEMSQNFLEILHQFEDRFTAQDSLLQIKQDAQTNTRIEELKKSMLRKMDLNIAKLQQDIKLLDAKFSSAARDKELNELQVQLKSFNDYKDLLETSFQESFILHQKQVELVEKFNKQMKMDNKIQDDKK